MVIPDLSAPEVQPYHMKSQEFAIAAVIDRFLAFILDFLIFSPVISLLVSGLIRQTKTFYLVDSHSAEGAIAVLLLFAVVFFLTTFLQTVFLYYWQATPGQLFMQLKVISYPQATKRLSFNQCWLRAFLWSGSFLFLALPFLEVASHPLRRMLHERASDTMVVTLKKTSDEGPMPLEAKFISSWMRMSFLFLVLFAVLGFFRTYHSLQAGYFGEDKGDVAAAVCKEMKNSVAQGEERLDQALALFLLNNITAECLNKEADAYLWGSPVGKKDLGYLAYFVTSEGEDQDKYFAKVCEDTQSPTCALARFLGEFGEGEDLKAADQSLSTTKMLVAEESFAQGDYAGSLKIIKSLQKDPALNAALEKRYVRTIWALNESQSRQAVDMRAPASAVEEENWLEDFKERYEFP